MRIDIIMNKYGNAVKSRFRDGNLFRGLLRLFLVVPSVVICLAPSSIAMAVDTPGRYLDRLTASDSSSGVAGNETPGTTAKAESPQAMGLC